MVSSFWGWVGGGIGRKPFIQLFGWCVALGFFGVFMALYINGSSVETALKRANAAAALIVQRKGVASVVPNKIEIDSFLKA